MSRVPNDVHCVKQPPRWWPTRVHGSETAFRKLSTDGPFQPARTCRHARRIATGLRLNPSSNFLQLNVQKHLPPQPEWRSHHVGDNYTAVCDASAAKRLASPSSSDHPAVPVPSQDRPRAGVRLLESARFRGFRAEERTGPLPPRPQDPSGLVVTCAGVYRCCLREDLKMLY